MLPGEVYLNENIFSLFIKDAKFGYFFLLFIAKFVYAELWWKVKYYSFART